MRKSNRGPALFDLLGKEKAKGVEPLKVPRWWEYRVKPGHASGMTSSSPDKATDSVGLPESPTTRPEPRTLVRANSRRLKPAARLDFELDGERIRISFTSLTAAVVIFAGLVTVLAAFELGHRFGDKEGFKRGHASGRKSYAAEASDEIEAARRQPPATHLIESLLKDADAQAQPDADDAVAARDTTEPERPEWIQDYTYIVAQEFPKGHADDAGRAQEFLAQRGISTERVRYPSGSMQLITTQGYNRNDPAQRRLADELLKKVRAIGAKYFAAGGGYKLEGYFKTLKDDTW